MKRLRDYADNLDPEVAVAVDNWFEENLGAGDLSSEERGARMKKLQRARAEAAKAREVALVASQEELLRMRKTREFNPVIVDEILSEVDRALLTIQDRK